MDTKSRGWTSQPAVKIISFILIIALSFVALNRIFATVVRTEETDVTPEILLADPETNRYFLDRYLGIVLFHASVLAYYGSEEAIISGAHLEWFEYENSYQIYNDGYFAGDDDGPPYSYDENGMQVYLPEGFNEEGSYETVFENLAQLKTPDGNIQYAQLEGYRSSLPELRAKHEQYAIQQQLMEFRAAQEYLDNTEGLLYYISIGSPTGATGSKFPTRQEMIDAALALLGKAGINISADFEDSGNDGNPAAVTVYSNVPESAQTADFFKSQPVYHLQSDVGYIERSYDLDYTYYSGFEGAGGVTYIAFSRDMTDVWNSMYADVRDAYVRDLSIMAACAVLILVLTVMLLAGAGRRSKSAAGEAGPAGIVHFNVLDKPYLDIGLALTVGWIVLAVFYAFVLTENIWFYKNLTAVNLLFAAVALLTVPPALLWLISLAKRLKAGQFWKHTLIYAILYNVLYRFLRFCVNAAKSLWAGTRLTFRVVLIAFISFFMMLFITIVSYSSSYSGPFPGFLISLIFTAAVTFFLLRYAGRINKLEQGARNASEGNYDAPIDAGGGELGSVANSINNISAGINTAVEQRMKSERLKTELITNVSHDIRTPLTSIITYTDLLKHEGLDCEKAPEYLDVLAQKSQRLKALTDELFEAAKAATGNIEVNLTELDIVSLINQVLGELDGAIKSSGLDLRTNLPERLPVRADGKLMWRVLENLLSNVFKYSLPASRVYLDAFRTDNYNMQIDVKNISAAELNFDPSELTERFKRGDDSRADGSSGLGLSIVQSFVSAQGGRFAVSIDGDLFKATVNLPLAAQPAPPALTQPA